MLHHIRARLCSGLCVAAVPAVHRFMRKPADRSLPLCFDVPVSHLQLLHHPNIGQYGFVCIYLRFKYQDPNHTENSKILQMQHLSYDRSDGPELVNGLNGCFSSPELSVNGELSSEAPAGFSKIVIHLKEEQHIEVNSSTIVVRDKQSITHHTREELLTVGRCCILIFPWWTCYKHIRCLLWREALTSSLRNRLIVCTYTYHSQSSSSWTSVILFEDFISCL